MTKKTTVKKSPAKVKVRFIASPTGQFNLGYHTGDVAPFDAKQAKILIDSGVAEKV